MIYNKMLSYEYSSQCYWNIQSQYIVFTLSFYLKIFLKECLQLWTQKYILKTNWENFEQNTYKAV